MSLRNSAIVRNVQIWSGYDIAIQPDIGTFLHHNVRINLSLLTKIKFGYLCL